MANGARLMVREKVFLLPLLAPLMGALLAFITTLDVPLAAGVPLSSPEVDKDNPAGNVPEPTLQV
jgi:hypothetical protein